MWCVQCMLRYSNSSIFGIMETNPGYHIWNLENVSANYVAQFNDDLNILLNNLTNEAAAGGSLRKYAAGSAIATDFMRLYALVQCTPDLSEQDCNNCLLAAIAYVPQCCAGKVGGSVLLPSCNIRFQVYSFFNSTAAPPSTNATTSKGIHAIMPITKQIMLSIIRINVNSGSYPSECSNENKFTVCFCSEWEQHLPNCHHYSCGICCLCRTNRLHLHLRLFKSEEAKGERRK